MVNNFRSIIFFFAGNGGSLAQLVEHWTLNPLVDSSSLSRPTKYLATYRRFLCKRLLRKSHIAPQTRKLARHRAGFFASSPSKANLDHPVSSCSKVPPPNQPTHTPCVNATQPGYRDGSLIVFLDTQTCRDLQPKKTGKTFQVVIVVYDVCARNPIRWQITLARRCSC